MCEMYFIVYTTVNKQPTYIDRPQGSFGVCYIPQYTDTTGVMHQSQTKGSLAENLDTQYRNYHLYF